MNMERTYREAKVLLAQIQEFLTKFDMAATKEESEGVKVQLSAKLEEFNVIADNLNIYVNKEPAIRRADAKMKVDQLKYDFQHLKAAFNNIQMKKNQRELEIRRREDLLSSAKANTNGSVNINMFMENEQSELIHKKRLANAHYEMDNMISHGEALVDNVKEQNLSLKNIKTKILNVTNVLGLSNTLIGLIERRNKSDKYVLFGGMAIVCLVMILCIIYLR